MKEMDEQELAGLLRALPPAPASWVESARQIPRVRRQVEEVLPFIESAASGRAAETADLERAIEAAGFTPDPDLISALRSRLTED